MPAAADTPPAATLLSWNGAPLADLCAARFGAWQDLRTWLGCVPVSGNMSDPAAWYPDATRILYLTTRPVDEALVHRQRPELMQREIEAWADESAPVSDLYAVGLVAAALLTKAIRHPSS